MSVYRKPGRDTWLYDFKLQGVRYHGSTGVKTTKKAAEKAEQLLREKAASGELDGVAAMTFDEACEKYWQEVGQHQRRAATVEVTLKTLQRLIGKDTVLGDINQAVVYEAVQKRKNETFARAKDKVVDGRVAPAKRYPLKNATVNRELAPLQKMLRMARTNWNKSRGKHGLPEIKWGDVKLPEPKGLSRIYTADERTRWVAAAAEKGNDLDLGVELLLTYGFRAGELFCSLSAFNLDPDAATISIHKIRKVDEILHLPLRKDHARRIAARVGIAREAKLDTIWFERVGKKTVALTYDQLLGRLRRAARAGGVDGGRILHSARHHAGSTILAKTGNLKAVQRLLGHASIVSSARYAHVEIDALRAALDDPPSRHSPDTTPSDKAANED